MLLWSLRISKNFHCFIDCIIIPLYVILYGKLDDLVLSGTIVVIIEKVKGDLKMAYVYDKKALNRLKRIEGQMKGVISMMEQGKECRDIVTQLSAIRNAVDRAMGVIVSANLEQCVRENIEKGEETDHLVKEAVELLIKSR